MKDNITILGSQFRNSEPLPFGVKISKIKQNGKLEKPKILLDYTMKEPPCQRFGGLKNPLS